MAESDKDYGLFSLPTMVGWFEPRLLANAAIRAAISPVFGTYADARSTQATADGFSPESIARVAQRYRIEPADCADGTGAIWFDYIADTGDGFDATYAMASLVAADSLTVARRGGPEHTLPTGRLLIFGGDQVYPYPSREEYQSRFVFPYEMAFSHPAQSRLAFVIPGNHDWYDGLNSFDFLFCQARYGLAGSSRIGNIQFGQHRSYFAVRLPHNWWIWGADIQFSQYLDVGQVRYFKAIAEQMRSRQPGEPEHKIILCIAEPGWQYESGAAEAALSNLGIITGIAEEGGAKVCTVLSGDTHHYCRYFSKELGLNLITAGGGGAFLHPTHQLSETIDIKWLGDDRRFTLNCRTGADGQPGEGAAIFPSKAQSFWLTWWNALFPVFNYSFATLLGVFYWLMTWMFAQTPIARSNCLIRPEGSRDFELVPRPFVEDILYWNERTCGLKQTSWMEYIQDLIAVCLQAGIANFLLGICALGLLVACIFYADAHRSWIRLVMGVLHWLAHIVAMITLYIVVNKFGTPIGKMLADFARFYVGNIADLLRTATYVVLMIFGGGTVAGLVWGGYLFVACAFFKRHWNEAYSALRLGDYKNFLRMKIEGEVLTIFPVGLKRCPTRLEWHRKDGKPDGRYVPRLGLSPELIDGPIVIDARNVRMRDARPIALAGDYT